MTASEIADEANTSIRGHYSAPPEFRLIPRSLLRGASFKHGVPVGGLLGDDVFSRLDFDVKTFGFVPLSYLLMSYSSAEGIPLIVVVAGQNSDMRAKIRSDCLAFDPHERSRETIRY